MGFNRNGNVLYEILSIITISILFCETDIKRYTYNKNIFRFINNTE